MLTKEIQWWALLPSVRRAILLGTISHLCLIFVFIIASRASLIFLARVVCACFNFVVGLTAAAY